METAPLLSKADWGIAVPGGWYDDSKHLYRDERGTIVPSVTQVFDILGFTDFSAVPPETLEWKRNFGTAVHGAVQLLVENDLDWETVDEQIIPAVTGVEMKLKDIQFTPQAAEENRVYNLFGMRYGGTLDHRGICIHQGVERHCVIDLKTAQKAEPYWKWQVAAYTADLEKHTKPWLGIVFQVDQQGAVKPHYYDTYTGLREFQVLLSTVLLGVNNGLYKLGR